MENHKSTEFEKMVHLEHTVEIAASPEQVWSVLSNLPRSPEFVPGIISAKMENLTRVCVDTDGNEIQEELEYYSATEQTYRLQHVKIPLPVSQSHMQFSVQPQKQNTLVKLIWELSFLEPALEAQLKPMIDGSARMTLEQLKVIVEKEQQQNVGSPKIGFRQS